MIEMNCLFNDPSCCSDTEARVSGYASANVMKNYFPAKHVQFDITAQPCRDNRNPSIQPLRLSIFYRYARVFIPISLGIFILVGNSICWPPFLVNGTEMEQ